MKNFKIGTISDIPIYLNLTLVLFLPVLAWLISRPEQIDVYADLIESLAGHSIDRTALEGGNTPLVIGAASAVGLMVGVLIHELGHSWAARRYDIVISSITLWIFGGMARMEELPEDWHIEFWVALAGPVTSVLLSGVFFGALQFTPADAPVLTFVVGWLAVVNLSLAVFNLIPAFPMDGGRILRALLARRQPYATATQRAARLAKILAVFGAIVALLGGAPLLIIIALFVYVAASSESRAVMMRELLRGFTATDLMTRDAPTVSSETSVSAFIERVFEERETVFPVVDGDTLVGIVTLDQARAVAGADREDTTVGNVMDANPATIGADLEAFEVILTMNEQAVDRLLVAEDGHFVGIVTGAGVVSAIQVLQGVAPTTEPEPEPPDGYV
jgi:Zn-dependent protease/CBS domain-containing protein